MGLCFRIFISRYALQYEKIESWEKALLKVIHFQNCILLIILIIF